MSGVAMDDRARGAGSMAVDISMWVASGPRQVTQQVPCLVTGVIWIMFFLENCHEWFLDYLTRKYRTRKEPED